VSRSGFGGAPQEGRGERINRGAIEHRNCDCVGLRNACGLGTVTSWPIAEAMRSFFSTIAGTETSSRLSLDLTGTMADAGGVGGLLWLCNFQSPIGQHFAAYDGNGNVVALFSATTSTETARYEFGPFGEPIRLTGPAVSLNPFRFSTKRTDNITDLVLYEYRIYILSLGGWLNRDPVAEKGGWNLYAFVRNNPILRVDILGLAGIETPEDAKRLCQAQIDKPPGEQPQISGPAPASECANALQILFTDPELKKLWGKFGSECPPPFFMCLCCSPKGFSGAFIPPRRPGEARMVYLCWNNLKGSPSEFKKTLLHELTHALQDCKGGEVDCKESLKREMEAYKAEGSCSDFSSCLEAAIRSSCAKGGFCSDANEVAAVFDELRRWFNAAAGDVVGFRPAPSLPALGKSYCRSYSTCF